MKKLLVLVSMVMLAAGLANFARADISCIEFMDEDSCNNAWRCQWDKEFYMCIHELDGDTDNSGRDYEPVEEVGYCSVILDEDTCWDTYDCYWIEQICRGPGY